jgi:hypothetical protein
MAGQYILLAAVVSLADAALVAMALAALVAM